MPQASNPLRHQIVQWFGGITDAGPARFLESRGFRLRDDWRWDKPTQAHTVSREEANCICFLMDEWDYGGLYLRLE